MDEFFPELGKIYRFPNTSDAVSLRIDDKDLRSGQWGCTIIVDLPRGADVKSVQKVYHRCTLIGLVVTYTFNLVVRTFTWHWGIPGRTAREEPKLPAGYFLIDDPEVEIPIRGYQGENN